VYYFNEMAELVFVTVLMFNTYVCRKKLTKRQKFKKPNNFRQANETLYWKIYDCVCQTASRTFVRSVKFYLRFS